MGLKITLALVVYQHCVRVCVCGCVSVRECEKRWEVGFRCFCTRWSIFFLFFFASYCIIFLLFAAFVFLKLTGRLCLKICNFYLNCAFIGVDILCCCSKWHFLLFHLFFEHYYFAEMHCHWCRNWEFIFLHRRFFFGRCKINITFK